MHQVKWAKTPELNQTFTGGSGILSCLCIDILLLLCLQTEPAGVSLFFCYCSQRLQLCNRGVGVSKCAECVVHRVCFEVFDMTSLIIVH